jgi:hypothetical protein
VCAVGYGVEWRLSHIAGGEHPSAAAIAELAGAPDEGVTEHDEAGAPPLAVANATPADSATRSDTATIPDMSAAARADSLRAARDQMYRRLVRHLAADLYATGWVTVPRAKRLAEWVVSESLRQGVPLAPGEVWPLGCALAFKLLAMPLLMLALTRLIPLPLAVRDAVVLQAAAPTAVSALLLAEAAGRDADRTAHLVLATTLLALVTVPLWWGLLSHLPAG